MRKFTTLCKDSVTNLTLVLSDCSYYQACDYLDELDGLGPYKGSGGIGVANITKICFEKASFFYDTERECLMLAEGDFNTLFPDPN